MGGLGEKSSAKMSPTLICSELVGGKTADVGELHRDANIGAEVLHHHSCQSAAWASSLCRCPNAVRLEEPGSSPPLCIQGRHRLCLPETKCCSLLPPQEEVWGQNMKHRERKDIAEPCQQAGTAAPALTCCCQKPAHSLGCTADLTRLLLWEEHCAFPGHCNWMGSHCCQQPPPGESDAIERRHCKGR